MIFAFEKLQKEAKLIDFVKRPNTKHLIPTRGFDNADNGASRRLPKVSKGRTNG